MGGRLIAIGDIHGCSLALDALIDAIQPQAEDIIVTLGDYVDRGNDSKGVIDRLIELSSRCHLKPIYGNHEEMMLEVVRDNQPPFRWLQFGGVETLDSYGFCGDMAVIPPAHRDSWIICCRIMKTNRVLCSRQLQPQVAVRQANAARFALAEAHGDRSWSACQR